MGIRRRVSEEERDQGEIGIFGKDERWSERPENAVTSIPRFLHSDLRFLKKRGSGFFLYQ